MIARLRNYWRVWRGRGAATMDHGLWAYWTLFGKYPPLVAWFTRARIAPKSRGQIMDKPMNKDGVSLCSHGGTCAENMIEHGGAFCASPPSTDGLVERLRRCATIEAGRPSNEILSAAADRIEQLTATLADRDATIEDLRLDAERFRALMRCPRIKMQGSAGFDPKTGQIADTKRPGGVHFGAEFWPVGTPHSSGQCEPTWGRHALRALADDILAAEAAALDASATGMVTP